MSRFFIGHGLRALAWALVLLVAAAGAARAEGVTLQWFGQAAVKITTPGGKVIVIDPFISKNPKTPDALKDLSKLGPVDLILLTHGHGDHIGDTVAIAEATGAKVALNSDLGRTFASLGWLTYEQMVRFNKSGCHSAPSHARRRGRVARRRRRLRCRRKSGCLARSNQGVRWPADHPGIGPSSDRETRSGTARSTWE